MNILWFNLKIDENNQALSFALDWINTMSLKVDKIFVITMEKQKYNLNNNVIVFSLGKELGYSRLRRFFVFYKLLFRILRKEKIDVAFSHMNPLFVVMAGFFLKIKKIPIYLWYCHKSVTNILRLSVFLSEKIFTCSEISMNVKTRKKEVIGHGINLERFNQLDCIRKDNLLLYVGRISPVKNVHILIDVIDLLVNNGYDSIALLIVGEPTQMQRDIDYKNEMIVKINDKRLNNNIRFVGKKNYCSMTKTYNEAQILLSLSDTGSVDKVLLEAMVCGCIPVSSNDSFKLLFENKFPELITSKDAYDVFDKVKNLLLMDKENIIKLQSVLKKEVEDKYSLEYLMKYLYNRFKK